MANLNHMKMRQNRKLFIVAVFAATALIFGMSCSNSSDSDTQNSEYETEDSIAVSNVENSECQRQTRSSLDTSITQVLVLTKMGDNISCELQNIYANCGLSHFDICSDYKKGKGCPDSLFVEVTPVLYGEKDCWCPYTVYFTINNIKANSFFLLYDKYKGIVSFKESSQVTIEVQ